MSHFAANLRCLRKSWGESQLDLATALYVGVSTISQYETGKRSPDKVTLQQIAEHYRVTVDDLLLGDLTDLPSMVDIFVNLKLNQKDHHRAAFELFPIFRSRASQKDEQFEEAIIIHQNYYSQTSANDSVSDADVDQLFYTYFDLVEKDQEIEVVANLLSLLFCIADINSASSFSDELYDFVMDASNDNLEQKARGLISNHILSGDSSKPSPVDLKELDKDILKLIGQLKKDPTFSSLGDYYFTLRYLYGIADNEMPLVSQRDFAILQLVDLSQLGNPYACRYLNHVKRLVD